MHPWFNKGILSKIRVTWQPPPISNSISPRSLACPSLCPALHTWPGPGLTSLSPEPGRAGAGAGVTPPTLRGSDTRSRLWLGSVISYLPDTERSTCEHGWRDHLDGNSDIWDKLKKEISSFYQWPPPLEGYKLLKNVPWLSILCAIIRIKVCAFATRFIIFYWIKLIFQMLFQWKLKWHQICSCQHNFVK